MAGKRKKKTVANRTSNRKKSAVRHGAKKAVGGKGTKGGPRRKGAARRQTRDKIKGKTAKKRVVQPHRDRCVVRLAIAEQSLGKWDRIQADCDITIATEAKKTRKGGAVPVGICRCFASLGHAQRANILRNLLDGPATYRTLQRWTGLKAGPLYHHINGLRLAGLLLPKQRDLYELTRGGRNLILGALALASVVRDKRRRPV